MLRRVSSLLGPHLVEYHEWHLHEPLLINYEGWRVLDNVKMTNLEAYVTDVGGTGRHLDPIIDDPRLTHQQRVCRLYRWALKEIRSYVSKVHVGKFNMAYKVVRQRFEKYRYVTDPAMCDMMVRETQKYLRETCNPHFIRNDHRSPNACQNHTNPMFHPDNAQCYDPWVQVETFWYDDAKVHRYAAHHPMNSQTYENHERLGDMSEMPYGFRMAFFWFGVFELCYFTLLHFGAFSPHGEDDPQFERENSYYDINLRHVMEQEERARRNVYTTSFIGHNWDMVLGKIPIKSGYVKWWLNEDWDKDRVRDVSPRFKDQPDFPGEVVDYTRRWQKGEPTHDRTNYDTVSVGW